MSIYSDYTSSLRPDDFHPLIQGNFSSQDQGKKVSSQDQGKRVIAYYSDWSMYGISKLEACDIDTDLVTHINYAFLNYTASGDIQLYDPWADIQVGTDWNHPDKYPYWGNLQMLHQKKLQAQKEGKDLKTLFSIGGWTLSSNFPIMAADPAARKKFVENAVAICDQYDMDGLDIDWEYPTGADVPNFLNLLKELRAAFDAHNPPLLLSMAAPAGYQNYDAIPLAEVQQYLDYINIMTYDFHGPWGGSNATLKSSTFKKVLQVAKNIFQAIYDFFFTTTPNQQYVHRSNYPFLSPQDRKVAQGWERGKGPKRFPDGPAPKHRKRPEKDKSHKGLLKSQVQAPSPTGGDDVTNHQSALKPTQYGDPRFNITSVVDDYLQAVPAEKLNVGIPLYYRTFAKATGGDSSSHLYSPYQGPGDGDEAEAGMKLWFTVDDSVKKGESALFQDESAKASSVYNPSTQEFATGVSLEDVDDITAFIQERGLGGAMAWELKGDAGTVPGDRSWTVMKRINTGLNPA